MKQLLSILCLASVQWSFFLTGATHAGQAEPREVESEEYAVYNALIEARYIHDETRIIVINEETGTFYYDDQKQLLKELEYIRKKLPVVTEDLTNDFKAKNNRHYSLKNNFKLTIPSVLVTKQAMDAIFKDTTKGWLDFYSRYPHSQGNLTLSRVAFNTKRDRALVYTGNQSDWLAGTGFYLYLEKAGGIWVIKNEQMTWIS